MEERGGQASWESGMAGRGGREGRHAGEEIEGRRVGNRTSRRVRRGAEGG